jgi:hypothetical protein
VGEGGKTPLRFRRFSMKKLHPPKGFGKPRHLHLHPEMAESYDQGKRADLDFFEANPGVTEFVRRPYPGEVDLAVVAVNTPMVDVLAVRVTLLPNLDRIREFFQAAPNLSGETKFLYIQEGGCNE